MANPETCLHNVVEPSLTDSLELEIWCLSCGEEVSSKRSGKNYRHGGVGYNIWVHVPTRRLSQTEPNQVTVAGITFTKISDDPFMPQCGIAGCADPGCETTCY